MANPSITPFLWFDDQAEEAVEFYCSVFADSKIDFIHRKPDGSALVIGFTLNGRPFSALNGGPMFKFTEAVSFSIGCDSQAEVDRLWEKLGEGGQFQACGWLKDKYGLSWQVVPNVFFELLEKGSNAQNGAVMVAMMDMVKFDIAALKAAFDAAA